jgi:hypothetical protein
MRYSIITAVKNPKSQPNAGIAEKNLKNFLNPIIGFIFLYLK